MSPAATGDGGSLARGNRGGHTELIRRHATELRLLLALFDASAAVVVLGLASVFRFGPSDTLDPFVAAIPNPLGALALYALAWPIALWTQGLYRTRIRLTLRGEAFDVLRRGGPSHPTLQIFDGRLQAVLLHQLV